MVFIQIMFSQFCPRYFRISLDSPQHSSKISLQKCTVTAACPFLCLFHDSCRLVFLELCLPMGADSPTVSIPNRLFKKKTNNRIVWVETVNNVTSGYIAILNSIGEYWLIKLQDVTKFCTLFKFFYGASTNQHQAGAFASPFQNDRLCGIGTNRKLAIGWKLLSLKMVTFSTFCCPKKPIKTTTASLLHQKFRPIFTKGTTSPADLMTKPMPRGAWWLRRAIESCYLFTVDLFDVIEYHELWGPHISRWLFCSCRSFFLPTNNTVPFFS